MAQTPGASRLATSRWRVTRRWRVAAVAALAAAAVVLPAGSGSPVPGATLSGSTSVRPPAPPRAGEAPVDGAEPARGRGVSAPAPGRWDWPLHPAPAVAAAFDPPPQPWARGHRGVDLRAAPDQPVRAPAAGRVSFAGSVVDRGVLTIEHPGGLRSSFQPVQATVGVGEVVARGDVVALVTTAPGHCPPEVCLHWGVRRGRAYLDPLTLLRPPEPPVLLPTSGSWPG